MKKPKGYRKITVNGVLWFWKVGRQNVHARSVAGKNIFAPKDAVPARIITRNDLDNLSTEMYDNWYYELEDGHEIRYFTPETIAEWIKGKS